MSKILVFDTETTGLPIMKGFNKYPDSSKTEFYDSSRIIELGYIIYENRIEVCRKNYLIKVPVPITNSHIHGITDKMVNESGHNMADVLDEFIFDIANCTLVAHNILFDAHVLMAECYRYNKMRLLRKLKQKDSVCTMNLAMIKLKLNHYPKLLVLYKKLNNCTIIQTHRAIDDVELCANCYFKLLDL